MGIIIGSATQGLMRVKRDIVVRVFNTMFGIAALNICQFSLNLNELCSNWSYQSGTKRCKSILFHPSNPLMNFKVIFQVQLALVLDSTLLIMAQLSVRGSGMGPCLQNMCQPWPRAHSLMSQSVQQFSTKCQLVLSHQESYSSW